jgi:hypothetical protein
MHFTCLKSYYGSIQAETHTTLQITPESEGTVTSFECLHSVNGTECRDGVASTPSSYSGGPRFKSRPETSYPDCYSWFSTVHPGKCRDRTLN